MIPHGLASGSASSPYDYQAEGSRMRLEGKPMHLQPVFGGPRTRTSKQKSVRSKKPEIGDQKSEVGSQGSGIVGHKSVRSRQRYPARVVGGGIAEDLFDRGLCLPSGTAMTKADLDRIIDIILSCHQK